ncbi:MAG: class I SAM-dependent rRNA methyltransferase [Planctomycetia bacterium]
MKVLVVRRGRSKPLWMGHPWVHADSVETVREDGREAPADLVEVQDGEGKRVGYALHSPGSLLVARLVTRAAEVPDLEGLLVARLEAAQALRARLFPDPGVTSAYRLVHSEGDGLPGLVVDRFGPLLVAQFATGPMFRRREALAQRLLALTGARSLLARPGGHEEEEGIAPGDVALAVGEPVPDLLELREAGMPLLVAPREGQKTGHFVDQRENRVLVGALCEGLEVLDLFTGTGGFALRALQAGARSVLAVDASERALAQAAAHARLLGVEQRLVLQRGDVREVLGGLRTAERQFGLVVLDPPSLFPRRGPPGAALKGYRELNVRALTRVAPGGFLATFTCSGRLDREGFLEVVRAAARECRAEVRVVRELGAGPDHPWSLAAPEGRYLTGLLLRVNA